MWIESEEMYFIQDDSKSFPQYFDLWIKMGHVYNIFYMLRVAAVFSYVKCEIRWRKVSYD